MLEMIWFSNILLIRIEAGETGEAGYGNGDENTPKMNIKNINIENNNMDMNMKMKCKAFNIENPIFIFHYKYYSYLL